MMVTMKIFYMYHILSMGFGSFRKKIYQGVSSFANIHFF